MKRRHGRVRRLLAHEGRWLASLVWWVARRRFGVAAGERALPYAAAQSALVYGLTFVCVVETAGVHAMLADVPVARVVMLVVDVYTVLMLLGFQAAAVTRPHVLGTDHLLLRDGARREIRIPLDRIASVRYDLRFSHDGKADKDGEGSGKGKGSGKGMDSGDGKGGGGSGVWSLAVGGQTSVTVELTAPVVAVRLSGRRDEVRTVRFHADDARGAMAAVRAARVAADERTPAADGLTADAA
ncbi:hypothetical protein [Streptomyces nigrescens]|uniref:hypothetical protein n=1 Tax=Streptomyces nigrescens TaxID=1920 RepID=UPI0021C42709|nr:hypothetical protein [Streptomyces nigrescens]